MGALTLRILNRAGRFTLESDDGTVTAHGIARASQTEPGFVTLTFTKVHRVWTPGTPIRVPADWAEAIASTNPPSGG